MGADGYESWFVSAREFGTSYDMPGIVPQPLPEG
jgi:hypothetical protein